MTQSFVYNTTPGQAYLYDSTIAYSNLLFCSREGVEFDVVYSTDPSFVPGSRQVQYNNAFGYLRFAVDFNVGERVQIIIGEI